MRSEEPSRKKMHFCVRFGRAYLQMQLIDVDKVMGCEVGPGEGG
jgi:membrane glycosyltransferase